MQDALLSESSASGYLSVDNAAGATYTIPDWADGVEITVTGAETFYRAGTAALVVGDIDVAGTVRDWALQNGPSYKFKVGSSLRKLFFRTVAAQTSVVVCNPYRGE